MAKYMIEVPHEPTKIECDRSISIFLHSGSHFLTHADWGCKDGVHKAWFIMEAENRDEVITIVPPAYRSRATIIQLNQFRLEDIEDTLKLHPERPS
jgi:hypothetical protein